MSPTESKALRAVERATRKPKRAATVVSPDWQALCAQAQKRVGEFQRVIVMQGAKIEELKALASHLFDCFRTHQEGSRDSLAMELGSTAFWRRQALAALDALAGKEVPT